MKNGPFNWNKINFNFVLVSPFQWITFMTTSIFGFCCRFSSCHTGEFSWNSGFENKFHQKGSIVAKKNWCLSQTACKCFSNFFFSLLICLFCFSISNWFYSNTYSNETNFRFVFFCHQYLFIQFFVFLFVVSARIVIICIFMIGKIKGIFVHRNFAFKRFEYGNDGRVQWFGLMVCNYIWYWSVLTFYCITVSPKTIEFQEWMGYLVDLFFQKKKKKILTCLINWGNRLLF